MRRTHHVFLRSALVDLRTEANAIERALKLLEGELATDAGTHVRRARIFAAAAAAELHMALQERLMPTVIDHAVAGEIAA